MANKYLIGGLILAAGIGGYYYLNKKQGQSSTGPASMTDGGPATANTGTTTAAPAASQDDQMRSALLQWATGTGNVPLYQAWINQLPSDQLANLYDILVNQWQGTGVATLQQETNWNNLVKAYPFLLYKGVKNGVKCTTFNCQ